MASTLPPCRVVSNSSDHSISENFPRAQCRWRRRPLLARCTAEAAATSTADVESEFDKKAFRRNLTRSKNYNRKGFGHKEETMELMSQEYTSKCHLHL